MKLDPRIKSLSDILTIFDIDRAKEFIGQKGYFANALYVFSEISTCSCGTLGDAFDTEERTFRREESGRDHPYFIPESSLKPEEKKYRPYTLAEFSGQFALGGSMVLRHKNTPGVVWSLILTGYKQEKSGAIIYIGVCPYRLDELFNEYEWEDPLNGRWVPFGVEVEE